uniref:probable palmitoyltransferase ZDHHC24 n=1 Tax=Styela clava TaxID=7725 RepID=UPI0019396422|nr:probable palmitoyltransferase ZDHHC24 [Styela clava]
MEPRKKFLRFRNEKIIFFTFTGLMLAVYLFEFFIILPRIQASDPTFHKGIHIFFGTLILINAYLSVWKFITTDATSGSRVLPSSLEKGWKYCWKCEANAPPRSYHCFTCHKCILVRDHHCVLVSHCVGHATMRYFLSMLMNMWVALLYSNILNFDFVWEVFHVLQPKTLLTMFVPWLAWVLGYAESETFVMAIMTSICLLGFMYCTVMLGWHGRNLLKGRTCHEMAKKIGFNYDLGAAENIAQVFGVNWKYAWISPIIPSPLPGDGISFKEKEFVERNGKGL